MDVSARGKEGFANCKLIPIRMTSINANKTSYGAQFVSRWSAMLSRICMLLIFRLWHAHVSFYPTTINFPGNHSKFNVKTQLCSIQQKKKGFAFDFLNVFVIFVSIFHQVSTKKVLNNLKTYAFSTDCINLWTTENESKNFDMDFCKLHEKCAKK